MYSGCMLEPPVYPLRSPKNCIDCGSTGPVNPPRIYQSPKPSDMIQAGGLRRVHSHMPGCGKLLSNHSFDQFGCRGVSWAEVSEGSQTRRPPPPVAPPQALHATTGVTVR